jgi:hypothetical protein
MSAGHHHLNLSPVDDLSLWAFLCAGYQHGYKAQLLFKPLPPCSDVAVM